jgi:parallel beta-helix repeat protein
MHVNAAPRRGAVRNTQLQGEMKIMKHARMFVALALLIVMLAFPTSTLAPVAFSQATSSAHTWYVAPTGTPTHTYGGSCSKPAENTISGAITDAAAGDTINVCPGTYTEQLTISKSLTITSTKGAKKTVLNPPPTMAADSHGAMNIVTISGATTIATLNGLTISGPAPTSCAGSTISFFEGIFVEDGATATISSNTIQHIRDNPIDGNQCGRAILVGLDPTLGSSGVSTVGHATINDNTISDYEKGGVTVDNTGSTATITGNTITGVGPTTATEQNGIDILIGAVASVTSNTIKDNECNIASPTCGSDILNNSQSCGIVVGFGSGATATVTGNTFSHNDIGIELYLAAGASVITSNTFTSNRYAGMELSDGTYTASSNTVTGGNVGIAGVAYAVNTSVTLSSNTISGTAVASIGAYASPGYTATILSS